MANTKGLEDQYVRKDNKMLRLGYTTGTCAASAAKAATVMLLTGQRVELIDIMTPKGIPLKLDIIDITMNTHLVSCGVRKDSGDDPDSTNGIMIYATVRRNETGRHHIDGGAGVGRVTLPGLEQPVGYAAINKVPRRMIEEAVNEICEENGYFGGLDIEISVPEGEAIGKRTFNPKLGIEGGISILGTSGIVEPMSEAALIESIRIEMKMKVSNGAEYLLISPGNYGIDFTRDVLSLDIENAVKCSNFIGETIDMAVDLGLKGILFISHVGKFIKVAGGLMNTHSRAGDARLELMAANAIVAGASLETVKRVLACITTDEAIKTLMEDGVVETTMNCVMEKIQYHLNRRAYEELQVGAVVFSNQYGLLGQTENAKELLKCLEHYTELG